MSPALAWGRLWQWNIHTPGLSATNIEVVRLPRIHLEGVDPPRGSGGRHPVPGDHQGVVPVQVHGMHERRPVRDPEEDDVTRGAP